MNNFFLEMSGNLHSYAFETSEIVPIPSYSHSFVEKSLPCCDTELCKEPDDELNMAEAKKWLTRKGKDLTKYERFILVMPSCDNMAYAGLAGLHKPDSWLNGMDNGKENFAATMAHELGHNLGAEHSEYSNVNTAINFPFSEMQSCQKDIFRSQ